MKEMGWSISWSVPLLPDVSMIPGESVFSESTHRRASMTEADTSMNASAVESEVTFL